MNTQNRPQLVRRALAAVASFAVAATLFGVTAAPSVAAAQSMPVCVWKYVWICQYGVCAWQYQYVCF
jgi:hypothetical protein